jgi:hypothetical protein
VKRRKTTTGERDVPLRPGKSGPRWWADVAGIDGPRREVGLHECDGLQAKTDQIGGRRLFQNIKII